LDRLDSLEIVPGNLAYMLFPGLRWTVPLG
jgi:hypothetical protein